MLLFYGTALKIFHGVNFLNCN